MAKYVRLKDGTFKKVEENEEKWKKNKDGSLSKVTAPIKETVTQSKASKDIVDMKTPQELTKKKNTRDDGRGKIFKSGSFDDGYQFGDLIIGASATATDFVASGVKGVSQFVEGITDGILYGVSDISKGLGAKKFAKKTKALAEVNDTQEWYDDVKDQFVYDSLLGEDARGVPEGLGQVGAMIGVGAIGKGLGLASKGVSALTTGTMFASSSGSGRSEAYEGGATDEEAIKYGLMQGGIDAGTELMFGGLGKGTKALGLSHGLLDADDLVAKGLTKGIKNQTMKNVAQGTIKGVGEGVEELTAGYLSAHAQKGTFRSEDDFKDIKKDQQLGKQFLTGMLVSDIAQAGSVVKASKQGVDYVSGYTQNEQSVVDKIANEQILEAEKDGKQLTTKEKNKIKNDVETMMQRGEIDIDTIESALGGETYKAHESLVKEAEEFETLRNTKQGEMSDVQQDRLKELKAKNTEKAYSEQIKESKSKLSEEVRLATQNDMFLQESYAERGRRGEQFTVSEEQMKKYSEKEREIVQKAIDYGEMNNTRKAHEFVDLVAKLSADKGVSFDFTNNEKLKNSGFAIEGKTINGFKQGNNITINLQSKNALNTVVGHEITHVLEGTALYDQLQGAVIEYAKQKGVYDSMYKDIVHLYRNQFQNETLPKRKALYDSEITADLVGQYIFSDVDFVRNLSMKNRNVFQKVYDEIKYMLKSVTSGSDAEKQLLKAKKIFEDVYRDTKKNTSDKTQLMIAGTTSLTHDEGDYYNALYMEKNGKSKEEIFNETGWYKGQDGKWRYEFDDSKMELLEDNMYIENKDFGRILGKRMALGNIIKHDNLFEAYPHFKEMKVNIERLDEGTRGQFSPSDFEITLNFEMVKYNSEQTKSTLAHEIQHAIQYWEDFASGSNPEYWESRLKHGYDSRPQDVKNEQQELLDKYLKYVQEDTEFVREMEALLKTTPTVERGKFDFEKFEQIEDDPIEWQEFDKWRDSLEEKYGTDKVFDFMDLKYDMDRIKTRGIRDNIQLYYDTLGEVEARDVQRRLDMTEEERKSKIPYSAIKKDVVFANGRGSSSENVQYSVTDNKGRTLTKEQQEKFKDSVVRDEEGNLIPLYHGTTSTDIFTEFKHENGVWLSTDYDYAKEYSGWWNTNFYSKGEGLGKDVYADNNLRIYEMYADIKNPFNIGEINGTLSDGKVSQLANALGHYVADKTGDMKQGGTVAREVRELAKDYVGEKTYQFTRAKEFIDFAKKQGFDGFVATEDGKKTYCVFNSADQVKLVTNKKPTDNADIRFSLSSTVEETKDLMAIHNLRSNELMKQIEMGGIPYPSIAVTKPSVMEHEGFGEISVILHKDSIDPKKNKYNKIYSADAYTPTFPSVYYDANNEVADKISSKVNSLYSNIPEYYQRSLSSFMDRTNINERLNSERGEQGLVERYANDYGMKQLYLAEKGETVPVEMSRTEVAMTDYQKETSQSIIDRIGEEAVRQYTKKYMYESPIETRKKWFAQYGEQVKEVYSELISRDTGMPIEEAREIMNGESQVFWMKTMREAVSYLENGGLTVKEEADYGTTQNKIDAKIDENDFKQWLQDLFKGIEGKKGLRNSKDLFTPSGKRRSFEQLHDPVTIDNVINIMRKGDQSGLGAFGTSNIQGASAQEFSSIEEVRANKDRIGKMSEEEHREITKKINDEIFEIGERYAQGKDIIDAKNTLVEAVAKYENKSQIAKYLKQFDYVYTYSDSIVEDIIALRDYIRSLPTPYFEAKPRRAVGLDEVAVYVIPNNADAKLKKALLDGGYSIAEYDPNVEGDRQRVVNQFDELKFSLSEKNKPIAPIKNGIYAEDIALEKPIAPINNNGEVTEIVQEEIYAPLTEAEANERDAQMDRIDSLQEAEEPQEVEPPFYSSDTGKLSDADLREVRKGIKDHLPLQRGRTQEFNEILQRYATSDFPNRRELYNEIKQKFGKITIEQEITDVAEAQKILRQTRINVSDNIKNGTSDYLYTMRSNFGKIRFSKEGMPVDVAYQELSDLYPHLFPSDIVNEIDQFEQIVDVANMIRTESGEFEVDEDALDKTVNSIVTSIRDINQRHNQNVAERRNRWFDKERLIEQYMETDDYSDLQGNPNLVKVFHERWDRNRIETEPQIDTTVAENLRHGEKTMGEKWQEKKEGIARKWAIFKSSILDKGAVFEDLSKVTKNRRIEELWDYQLSSTGQATHLIMNGDNNVNSLIELEEKVMNTGLSEEFEKYLYHYLNIDRMTLDSRFGIENKTVYGSTVTSEISQEIVQEMEQAHPEFKEFAKEVYAWNTNLRSRLVDAGIISQETADLWQEMYPHYVPIKRVDSVGKNINVPLATNRTGVNAPIKRAVGGNSDIMPLFDTMKERTTQTFTAINKNMFGVELKNTLGSTLAENTQSIDEAIEMIETQDALLEAGKNGLNPTFTVFENGKRVTFEITQEMYEALSPMSKRVQDFGIVPLQKASAWHRAVLTEYNPAFLLNNFIKDTQDVFLNSQHALKTYLSIPEAIKQLTTNGEFYQEYMRHGGGDTSYFDVETSAIAPTTKNKVKKGLMLPFQKISDVNNFVEKVPRMAEYIASRKLGKDEIASMLDASRVTTNFKAGGDVTKFLNKNGFTFLNASVQGANQQVRNWREANQNGLKGYVKLATKYALAGLTPYLLNRLLWDDDEEYEELSDYVKQNYYVMWKTEDGKFFRVPKGRAVAVIQDAVEQMDNVLTGDDEANFNSFFKLVISNLAPNNPITNNVVAPIVQVTKNEAWYGGDIVPESMQDLPSAEQFDESTDSLSKAIGSALNVSPMKVNYLLNQYSGVIGDVALPYMTQEVTSGDEGAGLLLAPIKDKFITDGKTNKQSITDFYDMSDKLTTNAVRSEATTEDVLKNKYFNSVKDEMNELYKLKREVQNSNLPRKEKYEKVRKIQEQISELAKKGLQTYEDVEVYDYYGRVNDKHFRVNSEGEWLKVKDKELAKQEKVTSGLGIDANEYWSKKEEYDYAFEYPGKYGIAKAVGGYETYNVYKKALSKFESDKNAKGESIANSLKNKKFAYINNLNVDYNTKMLLWKQQYPSDDRYNVEIIEYLNNRQDISYEEMVEILTELDFKVSADGTVRW